MRVCFISHSAGRYGAELALLELLEGLVSRGVDCKVLVPEKGPLLVELDRLRIEWRLVEFPRWRPRRRKPRKRIFRTMTALRLAFPMARAIREWKCDVVYTNTVVIAAGAFAAFLARRPHIWHLHEFGYADPNERFDLGKGFTTWLIEHLSTVIVANSHVLKQEYAKYIHPRKFRVIYQAVTLRASSCNPLSPVARFLGITAFKCVVVGSLQGFKAQDEAILAIAAARHQGIPATLLLVGGGDQAFGAALEQLAERCGITPYVIFHGYVENPRPFIDAADVVLTCSRLESFGRVTVEAMLAGKAVIGTASGGTIKLIQDGKTGLLYTPGDPDELATRIRYLYENAGERCRLGAAAQAWASGRFDQERYASEVARLLEEVLAREKSQAR